MPNEEHKPRCIYTKKLLVIDDKFLRPSHEHIVPLSLGGSNQFTTDEVCAEANSRAGKEIDDAVASQLTFLGQRQKYGLKGNRGTIPNVRIEGHFLEIPDANATIEIDADANVSFRFHNEQKSDGQLVQIGATEDRLRFLLKARLKQANERSLKFLTPFGQIKDEEDIEAVIMLSPRTEAQVFKAPLKINLAEYHSAVVRLSLKIAICLGHRVLGRSWTFGAGGDLLRAGLWHVEGAPTPQIRGQLGEAEDLGPLPSLLNISPDRHTMAVLPVGDKTVAIVALFGGLPGIAVIDLGVDSSGFFEEFGDEDGGGCIFEIPLSSEVSRRRLVSRTFRDLANGMPGFQER